MDDVARFAHFDDGLGDGLPGSLFVDVEENLGSLIMIFGDLFDDGLDVLD